MRMGEISPKTVFLTVGRGIGWADWEGWVNWVGWGNMDGLSSGVDIVEGGEGTEEKTKGNDWAWDDLL